MKIRQLSSAAPDFDRQLDELLAYEATADEKLEATVAAILADVRARGDAAVLDYTAKFDRLSLPDAAAMELPRAELQAAFDALPEDQRAALEAAAARVTDYHQRQVQASWLGQQVTPLDRVGLYVPGGKAAYPSSVLMNALPAKVAGVAELIMVVPTPDGLKNQLVLAAAFLAGVDRVFTIGGAQAVGALAYGTATIPKVDKIVGPGNAYVAAAKRRVFGVCGIDMIAGPSEILVICDGKTDPDWVAMDLFSQAEHDELAQAILLSPDADFIKAVAQSATRLLAQMPRREIIQTALENRGALIHVASLEEACAISNHIAPEHLEMSVDDAQAWLPSLKHAGAIFMGRYTSEALGDYCAGPNHVLPTSGFHRRWGCTTFRNAAA
jgi:histidinol dehydrogenase